MDARRSVAAWIAIVLVALSGCGSSSSGATTGPSDASAPRSPSGASGGANGGGAGGGAGDGGAPKASTVPTVQTLPATTEPDTSLLTTPDFGAYTVKQIETLGGESIHGLVCDVRHPFAVDASTSKVAWVFLFTPTAKGTTGNVSYAYSIPSAGESHDAKGTYQVSDSDASGTRHVALTVSDHVVFKGFDGNIPLRYKFDLLPAATCPAG